LRLYDLFKEFELLLEETQQRSKTDPIREGLWSYLGLHFSI